VKKITVTANSVSEALAQVQKEYGVREDEYSYKVIEKGFKGIFGLMSKEAVVEVTLKEGFFKRKLEEFLRSILDNFGEIQVRWKAKTWDDSLESMVEHWLRCNTLLPSI